MGDETMNDVEKMSHSAKKFLSKLERRKEV